MQAAVDTKHHLVVAHEVTNNGSDRGQLANMALQAKDAIGKPKLRAIADRGTSGGPQDCLFAAERVREVRALGARLEIVPSRTSASLIAHQAHDRALARDQPAARALVVTR